jgi:hypothetical protein
MWALCHEELVRSTTHRFVTVSGADLPFSLRSVDLLKCLRLAGDSPGFLQERIRFPRPLPRSDLVLDLGSRNWVSLYPFVVASTCPRCRHRETFFLDQQKNRRSAI